MHMDHSLNMALDRMGASQLDVLPVVNRANVHKLEGIVTLQDVLRLYGVGREKQPWLLANLYQRLPQQSDRVKCSVKLRTA